MLPCCDYKKRENTKVPDYVMYILLGVLVIAAIGLFMIRGRKSKQQQADHVKFLEEIKIGDRVRTHIGVYGKIVSITETTDGKVFMLEIGDKKKSEIEVDYRVIAGPDDKQILQFDADGNVIMPEEKKPEIAETPKQIENEQPSEEPKLSDNKKKKK